MTVRSSVGNRKKGATIPTCSGLSNSKGIVEGNKRAKCIVNDQNTSSKNFVFLSFADNK